MLCKTLGSPHLQNLHVLSAHSATSHDLFPMGFSTLCNIMLGHTQVMHTFIVCKTLLKELVRGLGMQQLHCLGSDWTEKHHMFIQQTVQVLSNSIGTIMDEIHLQTISNIKIPTTSIVTVP